jgi:hypothetical protein
MQREHRLTKWRRGVAIVAVLALLAGTAIYIFRGPDIPSDALKALTDAEHFELLSLDPTRQIRPCGRVLGMACPWPNFNRRCRDADEID